MSDNGTLGFDVDVAFAAADDEEGVWIPFHGKAEVRMTYVSWDRVNDLRKRKDVIEKRWEHGRLVNDVDDDKLLRIMAREVVKGWRGFVRSDGSEFPFNHENLDRLISKSLEFAQFVNTSCMKLENFVREKERAEEKN